MNQENNIEGLDELKSIIGEINVLTNKANAHYSHLVDNTKELLKELTRIYKLDDIKFEGNIQHLISYIDFHYLSLRTFNRELKTLNAKVNSLKKFESDNPTVRLAITNSSSDANMLVSESVLKLQDYLTYSKYLLANINKKTLKEFVKSVHKDNDKIEVKSLTKNINTKINHIDHLLDKNKANLRINNKYNVKNTFMDTYHPLLNTDFVDIRNDNISYNLENNKDLNTPSISINEIEDYHDVKLSNKDKENPDLVIYSRFLNYLYKQINQDKALDIKLAELSNEEKQNKLNNYINKVIDDVKNNIKLSKYTDKITFDLNNNSNIVDKFAMYYVLRTNGYVLDCPFDELFYNNEVLDIKKAKKLDHYKMYKRLTNDYTPSDNKLIDPLTTSIARSDYNACAYNNKILDNIEDNLLDLTNSKTDAEKVIAIAKFNSNKDKLKVVKDSDILNLDISALREYSNLTNKIDANEIVKNIKKMDLNMYKNIEYSSNYHLDKVNEAKLLNNIVLDIYKKENKDITLDQKYLALENYPPVKKAMGMYDKMEDDAKDFYDRLISSDYKNVLREFTPNEITYLKNLYESKLHTIQDNLKQGAKLDQMDAKTIATYIKLSRKYNSLEKRGFVKYINNRVSDKRKEEILDQLDKKANKSR